LKRVTHFAFRFTLLLLLTLFTSSSYAEPILINKIEAKRDRGFDYLDIYSSSDAPAKGLLLENQLILEFPGAKISSNITIEKRKSTRIQNIRVSGSKVIIDLKKGIDYDLVSVFGRGKTVVEISDRLDEAEKIIAAWEKRNLALVGAPLKSKKLTPTFKGGLSGKVIVVDPGHGGKDPGAESVTGVQEKTLTLATAQKLAKQLSALGATVYLTRDDDSTSNLKQIVAFTNKIKPALFISVHYNYSSIKDVSGTETYYYSGQSRPLAVAVHEALTQSLGKKDRGLRRAMFYAIHHAGVPAILIEPLYLSSYNDEKLAKSADFQEKIAQAVAQGVKNYFRVK